MKFPILAEKMRFGKIVAKLLYVYDEPDCII